MRVRMRILVFSKLPCPRCFLKCSGVKVGASIEDAPLGPVRVLGCKCLCCFFLIVMFALFFTNVLHV